MPLQTEGRDSEETAGESCGGHHAQGKLSDQLTGERHYDIEAGNPLGSVAIDGTNPLAAGGSAPAAAPATQPAGGMAGRLAKVKQLLWRKT